MLRQLLLGTALALAATSAAHANGRPPSTSTITFRQGNEQHIVAGMTFGATFSHDGGATWHWMCEDAILYAGNWDPDYAYTASGAIFATTFGGLLVNRNGCEFEPTQFGESFMSAIGLGPDGALYSAGAQAANPAATPPDPGDAKIHKSTDDGLTFPVAPSPGLVGDWWTSLEVAPSNAQRVYLTGYRFAGSKQFLMFRSNDGGTSYTAMATTGITTTANSQIDIVAIGRTDPDLLFARVTYQIENAISDGIYRSTDAGQTWTQVLMLQDEIAVVLRANGDLVAGTRSSGVRVSRAPSNGAVWEDLPAAPHINCLVENAAGEVWACTQNFGGNQVLSDDAGIMKSTDLVTWTKVLRYQDIAGPVDCAPGTLQRDQCVDKSIGGTTNWCILRAQLGIVADPTVCATLTDSSVPDDGGVVMPPKKGCCDNSASGGPMGLAMTAVVATVLGRRRRRVTRAPRP